MIEFIKQILVRDFTIQQLHDTAKQFNIAAELPSDKFLTELSRCVLTAYRINEMPIDLPFEDIAKIFQELDLKSILRTCQVNVQFRDICKSDTLWKYLLHENYPVYYRKYGLNSISPKERYIQFDIVKNTAKNALLQEIIDSGSVHLAKIATGEEIISFHVEDITNAAFKCHVKLVSWWLEKQASVDVHDLNRILEGAAAGGCLGIVQMLLERGATGVENALGQAAIGNRQEIVEWLLQYDDSLDINIVLVGAAIGGYLDLAQWTVNRGATDFATATSKLSYFGDSLAMLDWLLDHGVNPDDALSEAVINNFPFVKHLVLVRGATDLNRALETAAASVEFNENIIDWLIDHGATALNSALVNAAKEDNLLIVQKLVERGATNLSETLEIAQETGSIMVEVWLTQHLAQ